MVDKLRLVIFEFDIELIIDFCSKFIYNSFCLYLNQGENFLEEERVCAERANKKFVANYSPLLPDSNQRNIRPLK